MNDIENRAREYIAEHSEYSEVLELTFVAVLNQALIFLICIVSP